MEQPLFKVNERSTRDRLNLLMKKLKEIIMRKNVCWV